MLGNLEEFDSGAADLRIGLLGSVVQGYAVDSQGATRCVICVASAWCFLLAAFLPQMRLNCEGAINAVRDAYAGELGTCGSIWTTLSRPVESVKG